MTPTLSSGRRQGLALLVALPALTLAFAAGAAGQTAAASFPPRCPTGALAAGHAADLWCLDLLPTARAERARGAVLLAPARSPFGVSVAADGTAVYDVAITIEGLPDPAALGPYTRYMAWAMTPSLSPVYELGQVDDGVIRLGTVALDKFLILVTAESDASGETDPPAVTWRGPVVLRGTSPSMRLQPHELPALLAAGVAGAARPGGHVHGGPPMDGWVAPPMHPAVPMIEGLDRLRPDVAPWLPPEDPSAPEARSSEVVPLDDGDTLDLVAGPVRRTIKGRPVTLYAFNGQIPGPLIRVPRGAEIVVRFANRIDLPATIHWHGIRLENRFDGVPGVTQEPVPPGGTFVYRVRSPDGGIYWYHPHHRADVLQDLGLYGNLLVDTPGAFGPVHREIPLVLDDLLVADEGLVPWGAETATHALTGRFGNVALVNGEPFWEIDVARGEVVRLYLTNVSNTRTWNVSLPGARVKVVATDVGRFERQEWVESVAIAPAERYVVEAKFERAGSVPLIHRAHGIDMIYGNYVSEEDTLGVVRVGTAPVDDESGGRIARDFGALATNLDVVAEIDAVRGRLDDPPDRTLVLTVDVDSLPFPLGPILAQDRAYFPPLEWAGTMPEMNWVTTGRRVRWSLVDAGTGRRDGEIGWHFRRGDVVKVRLINDREAFHAMHHPIHVHGQRFLVAAVNGVPRENRAWKDTVIVPAGGSVDVLIELSNPGDWMLHCHVAEHLESGMQTVFTVE
jgi:FtsP/CotA-like multicopper oxidase with cupredoxin domain